MQIKFPDRENTDEYVDHGQMNGDVNGGVPVRHCDVIRITGKEENCLKAKQALFDLVPVTINVDVPFDLHRSIIGQKGRDVKELMDRFDVHIVLSPTGVKEDVIKVSQFFGNFIEIYFKKTLYRLRERLLMWKGLKRRCWKGCKIWKLIEKIVN